MGTAGPQPTHRTVSLGSRQIHLAEFGAGPALLMLHGGGPGASGVSNYSRNVEVLARQFRVLVPDMPGYGRSSKDIDAADPFGDIASAMRGLLDALEIPRAHVVGNSLGGAVALRLALDRPDRVGRLVLMGPGGIGIAQGKPTPGLLRLLTYYAGEGPTFEKLRSFITEDLVYDASGVSEAMLRERFESSIDPAVVANPPLRVPPNPEAFRRMDFLLDPRLADFDHPTLILWGCEDRVNPSAAALALQARLPRADVFLFSRTGHWVQWERAAEFNATVAAFLGNEA
ncbi:4,5:9,10-diseco-3-hydroxy-5,9,17-trioxoandrosta-1(10),2-diene-4-oate hydrolase [Variovorax sp. HW608]|uniref:alpha/beta fold hydrolase n=1 Tax=Variovorax sp. HW608 TaxID=1034889 RepID=UPI00081F9475|nr:alpha/beta fold hydrolase [Variovorax sp. HW608]SCK55485.1 4,5:9,10-diseco-3-hydroxy-5,9,17-trioxoandrosta-1(10),2-diene-4-oate hydrolase [Variovorax sp. HW608]